MLLTGRTSPAFSESTIQSGRTMGLGSLQAASKQTCSQLYSSADIPGPQLKAAIGAPFSPLQAAQVVCHARV